jgi:NAD(P)-dependent dehydrogenase (short-subunit alcohol dehydrogenase family)
VDEDGGHGRFDVEVRDSVALVTGAAVETGRAIALRLAREGAAVVVADIDERSGRETVQAIEANGGSAAFVRADMTSDADVAGMLTFAQQWRGAPQILVNNAGGGGHIEPHFPDATPAQWSSTLELNLRGPMLATQLALDGMRASGGGAVVNVSSTGGLGYRPYQSPEYGAAKAGLIRFTATLAGLRDRIGVRVNCVVPDWIATERAQIELAGLTARERAELPTPVPMDDVAAAVVRFVRDDALAGWVMVLIGDEPPRLIDAERAE